MPGGYWPGTGAILAAVEVAGDATAEIVGKPQPGLFLTALDRFGPGRTLMVGDRLDSDLAGAHAAGLDGAIVLSGATGEPEARAAADPSAGRDRRDARRPRARAGDDEGAVARGVARRRTRLMAGVRKRRVGRS